METEDPAAGTGHPEHSSNPSRPEGGLFALALSAEGVYGLVIVAGLIVVSRNLTGSSADALLSVVATVLVFFAAHVYAIAVSRLAGEEREAVGTAIRHGVRHSAGLLLVAVIPIAVLTLGVVGLLGSADAVWLALGADIVLLCVLGWFIAAARARTVWMRVVSMLVTAAFGGILIALKALLHH